MCSLIFLKMKHKLILTFFVLPLLTMGQEPLHYWGKTDSFLVAQANETFSLIHEILREQPPSTEFSTLRKSALLHVDWILHDTRLDQSTSIYRFMQERMQLIAEDLLKPVKTGMKVYKLYNHGFIVKTNKATIAFDLYRGVRQDKEPYIANALMEQLVKQCDIMFVSHRHSDHADWEVAKMFINQQKTVVVPTGLWADKGHYIKQMRSEDIIEDKITLANQAVLNVKVMPGHQDDVPNNVYIVTTPEGISVAHTGDQWSKDKDGWIDHVKDHSDVDVLLVHCWAMPLEKMANGFNPKLIINGHENELTHHSVDHREPYWLNERRMRLVKQPRVYMTWGEHYTYKK